MTEVYVMTLDYYYDDYKRPEGSSEVIGIKKNCIDAYKTIFKLEFEKNSECYNDRFVDEFYLESFGIPRKKGVNARECKYRLLYKELGNLIEITDKFLSDWEDARYKALGDSEFGIHPTGYTAGVSKFVLD